MTLNTARSLMATCHHNPIYGGDRTRGMAAMFRNVSRWIKPRR